ncbi:MAG TPA: amidohydrolase family protein [Dehalococcoidia bacterium]|nr:amidohydrolase family protein [Dehalococcoidia bacterium]
MNNIIIDAYAHISPPKYTEFIKEKYPIMYNNMLGPCVPLYDMDTRFRIMDKFPEVVQVLTIGPVPPIEHFANESQTVELAKMANDEMAELCLKYREKFVTAIALLPMNNIDAALQETDRAIKELGFKGIYVHSNINGKPLDAPEFLPLWEKMANYDLPVYIHPWRPPEFSDYTTEKESKYNIAGNFGWPYETTVAMTRIIFSGILDKYPTLKIVTHHCGGMTSFYAGRIYQHYGSQRRHLTNINKTPLEYYKMFYNDTAIHGNTPALMLAYDFWGSDKLVFGADLPLGDYFWGSRSYRVTIDAINAMNITDEDKKKIFLDNSIKLLGIPI